MAAITEASDDRLRSVSFTSVAVSSCLQFARVYWIPLAVAEVDERERKRLHRALARASGFFRARLASKLHVRLIPELRFIYDESVESGRRIEAVLAGLDIPPEPVDQADDSEE